MSSLNEKNSLAKKAILLALDKSLARAQSATERRYEYETVRFDLRGRAAGQLVYRRVRGRVSQASFRFNLALYDQDPDRFVKEVVPHEVAHLVAYQLHGSAIKPHGQEWKMVMTEIFGLPPTVTHSFAVAPSNRKAYLYRCACPSTEHRLGIIRHNRIRNGAQRYLCRKCREPLRAV